MKYTEFKDMQKRAVADEAATEQAVNDLLQQGADSGRAIGKNMVAWGAPSAVLGGVATGTGAGVITDAIATSIFPKLKNKKAARILLASLIGVPAGAIGAVGIGGLGAGYGGFRAAKAEIPNMLEKVKAVDAASKGDA